MPRAQKRSTKGSNCKEDDRGFAPLGAITVWFRRCQPYSRGGEPFNSGIPRLVPPSPKGEQPGGEGGGGGRGKREEKGGEL